MDVHRVCRKKAVNMDALVLVRKLKVVYSQTSKALRVLLFLQVQKGCASVGLTSPLYHMWGTRWWRS
jgi:hypothetical protein